MASLEGWSFTTKLHPRSTPIMAQRRGAGALSTVDPWPLEPDVESPQPELARFLADKGDDLDGTPVFHHGARHFA